MIGVALRATMDIDTTIKNLNLSEEDIRNVITKICEIDLQDDVQFKIKQLSHIMDEMEYPGLRITMNALLGPMIVPMKIDVSTGDKITPREIQYDYKLLLEDRTIPLWTYNLETPLAEKLQTVLARGPLNTRMRDYYDIHELLQAYHENIDPCTLKMHFRQPVPKEIPHPYWKPACRFYPTSRQTTIYQNSGILIGKNTPMHLIFPISRL